MGGLIGVGGIFVGWWAEEAAFCVDLRVASTSGFDA